MKKQTRLVLFQEIPSKEMLERFKYREVDY